MTDIVPAAPIGGGDKAKDVHSSGMSVRGANLPPTVDARLKAVESYWLAIRPVPGQLPGYQHFQPLELSPYWPWMWIFNVHHLPLRFSYRFIGSEHMRAMELEATAAGSTRFALVSRLSPVTSSSSMRPSSAGPDTTAVLRPITSRRAISEWSG